MYPHVQEMYDITSLTKFFDWTPALHLLHVTKCTDKNNIFLVLKFSFLGEDVYGDISEDSNDLLSSSSDISVVGVIYWLLFLKLRHTL